MNLLKIRLVLKVIVLLLVVTIVNSAFLPVIATPGSHNETAQIKFLNYAEVLVMDVMDKPKLILPGWYLYVGSIGGGKIALANITPIDSTLQLNSTCTCCTSSRTRSVNSSIFETSTVIDIEKHESRLRFIEVLVSNGTNSGSYTFYLLEYRIKKADYNVTILTRIFTDHEKPSNYVLFQTITNIESASHALPVSDIVRIANKTSLSEHYRILAKTLEKLALIEGETKYIWKDLSKELENLARLVEKYLDGYDKKAYGVAVAFDGPWHWLCVLICNVACAVGCGAGTAVICAAACAGPCAGCISIWACPACIACVALCGGIAGAVCYIIGAYGCAPGCDWICSQAGW